MPNKNILITTILLIILAVFALLIGAGVYISQKDSDDNNDSEQIVDDNDTDTNDDVDTGDDTSSVQDGFEANSTYIGNNTWSYQITGTLPNPCYSYSHNALVAESFPEMVTIILKVNTPRGDGMCAQVIQDVNLRGEYSASEDANWTFQVQ